MKNIKSLFGESDFAYIDTDLDIIYRICPAIGGGAYHYHIHKHQKIRHLLP